MLPYNINLKARPRELRPRWRFLREWNIKDIMISHRKAAVFLFAVGLVGCYRSTRLERADDGGGIVPDSDHAPNDGGSDAGDGSSDAGDGSSDAGVESSDAGDSGCP